MLDFLNYLGNKVVGRYKTVESNIRNRSNSFYDSFLDLLEDTVKTILMNEDIGYDGRTCGEILREPDVNNFFKHKTNMDKDIYSKVGDYIKKINEHKHHNEKYVNVDTVINYMFAYYGFVTPYLIYKGIETKSFNEAYFRGIYGVTLERSKELDNVSQKVAEYVSTTNAKIDEHSARIAALEDWSQEFSRRQMQPQSQPSVKPSEKNGEKEAMHWFFRTSKKSWRWFGNQFELNKSKSLAIFSHVLLLVLGLLTTIVTSISTKTYSTFTLFENIWLIFGILLLVYAVKAKLTYESGDLAKNTNYKYEQDQFGLWNPGKEKAVFKVFRWLGIIAVIGNIIYIWNQFSNISWLATILEVLFLGSIIFSFFMNVSLFAQYTIIYLEGKNMSGTEYVKLVWDPMIKQFLVEEEYKKKMPFLYGKY